MDIWGEITIVAWTVAMEAGGEPYEGKLAVAYVVQNRAAKAGSNVFHVCFKPWQFSCWNTDSPTRTRLDETPAETMAECYRAACSARWGLEPDPAKGATHYLNEEVTKRINNGRLPDWFREDEVTARIGQHTFCVA